MTQPYSVTTYGMYQQLLEELNTLEESGNKPWVGDKWVVARLLTSLNDRAIVATVEGARLGQEFLKRITKEVVAKGNYIFFTTPFMHFPVLQKIHRTRSERISTELGKLTIRHPLESINSSKMISGIAPNYIHSLDATLMFMTIERLLEAGCKDFHLIHDSFGVPITHVTLLNKHVREAYIDLFESEPLKRFIQQVHNEAIDEVDNIMINTLDLNDVRESNYIFS